MAWAWAKIVAALVWILKPIAVAIIWMTARRSALNEFNKKQAEHDAQLSRDYAEILANRPEPGESADRMRSGTFGDVSDSDSPH